MVSVFRTPRAAPPLLEAAELAALHAAYRELLPVPAGTDARLRGVVEDALAHPGSLVRAPRWRGGCSRAHGVDAGTARAQAIAHRVLPHRVAALRRPAGDGRRRGAARPPLPAPHLGRGGDDARRPGLRHPRLRAAVALARRPARGAAAGAAALVGGRWGSTASSTARRSTSTSIAGGPTAPTVTAGGRGQDRVADPPRPGAAGAGRRRRDATLAPARAPRPRLGPRLPGARRLQGLPDEPRRDRQVDAPATARWGAPTCRASPAGAPPSTASRRCSPRRAGWWRRSMPAARRLGVR